MQIIKRIVEVFTNPSVLLVISLVCIGIGKFFFKIQNAKCIDIVKKHFECFSKDDGKVSKIPIMLYFGVPMLLAVALAMVQVINSDAINIITIIISILTSMFFTLLTLVLDMRAKTRENKNYTASEAKIIIDVLKETYYSIMFEILVSVLLLIFCFLDLFASNFSFIESIIIYYMTLIVLTNLFIILKRIFKVIEQEMK